MHQGHAVLVLAALVVGWLGADVIDIVSEWRLWRRIERRRNRWR
jgi:hypothetical protein